MRIVALVNNLEFGGTERRVVHLAGARKANGHSLSVNHLKRGGPLQRGLDHAGIDVFLLDAYESLFRQRCPEQKSGSGGFA